MGTAIMLCIFVAYGYGILKAGNVGHLFSVRFQNEGFSEFPKAIWNAFVYAGFQCVQIPTMLFIPMKGKPQRSLGALSKTELKGIIKDVLKVEL